MKLKRFFASFSIVCLISSVSLVPCFAEVTNVNTTDTECSVFINDVRESSDSFDEFLCPTTNYVVCAGPVVATNSSVGVSPHFWTGTQFLFEEDKTLYWNIYPVMSFGDDEGTISWSQNNLTSKLPTFYVGIGYTDETLSSSASELTVTRVALGNQNLDGVYSNTYRVTIPAKAANGGYHNNFRCEYPYGSSYSDSLWWVNGASGHTVLYYIDMFQFVDTSDSALLALLDDILAEAQEANLNLSNILTACNNVIVELKAIGADTDSLIEICTSMRNLLATQLWRLEHIDNNVEAIYYFLTEELKDESDELSEQAGVIAGNIDNNQQAEDYYQATMQGNYEAIGLENFEFGGLTGGLELVGAVFTDMWNAFGSYSILFSYPLVLGIALLVIGRISKHGGGNSSRTSEHKGGEGGG